MRGGMCYLDTMQSVQIKHDTELPGYVISMPDFVTLEMLTEWKQQFDLILENISENSQLKLLIDTGKHDFESVACLKFLRDYLSDTPAFQKKFVRAAFVAPANFVQPHIVSQMEAYFNVFSNAYLWLKK